MKKIIYKDIAQAVDKTESAIKSWKKNHPKLLEIATLGTYCKQNNLSIELIDNLIKLKETLQKS